MMPTPEINPRRAAFVLGRIDEVLLHKAKELPKEGFKCAVERHLTGKETEPWEILYFKAYKSQLPVVEKALETAALMH
jgi:hypothetical protein